MAEGPKKFGRYFLLDLLAQGGMAEIYRARLASSEGAGRLLVIKRIQPTYGNNPEFLSMFKSEIKVTMGFNHPNIVQLYDFGEEASQPYIAMEFVDGKNLRQFMSRFLELKQRFPVDLAVHIIEQAACGLHYAHSFKDKITGQPLNVVHRDISPQNLLISYEGTIKVIDFGIAKAAVNVDSTRAGVIKGKPSYLSPEQINGDVLDGRSDVFSLGTVLWELLAGRKLFAGENDLAVLKLIESCQTHVKPPSTLNPDVPPELDYIILKALAKHRDKRYQSAEDFQRALHKFLYNWMPDFNPSDLAYYAKDLFKKEIVEDRKRIQRLNEEVEKLLSGPPSAARATSVAEPALDEGDEPTTVVELKAPKPTFTVLDRPTTAEQKVEIDKTLNAPPSPRYRSMSNQSIPAASRPAAYSGKAVGASARNLSQKSRSHAKRRKARAQSLLSGGVAAVLALMLFGEDLGVSIPYVTDFFPKVIAPVFVEPTAKLVLDGSEGNVEVRVNDRQVANSLPVTLKNLPAGTSLKISVISPDGRSFDKDVMLKRGEEQVLPVALAKRMPSGVESEPTVLVPSGPQLAPPPSYIDAARGQRQILLRLNITPGGGSPALAVNGVRVNPDNPVIWVDMDTDLELVAQRPGYKPIRMPFVLDSRQMAGIKEWIMDVQMEPLHFGYLNLKSTPSADATIMLDGRPWTSKTPLENVKIPVGAYEIDLVNRVLGMEKKVTISVQEGQIVTVDVPLDIKD